MRNMTYQRVAGSIQWWVGCGLILFGISVLPVWPVALLPLGLGLLNLDEAGRRLDHAYGFSA